MALQQKLLVKQLIKMKIAKLSFILYLVLKDLFPSNKT